MNHVFLEQVMPERVRIPCPVPGCGSYRQGDWLAHEASTGHRRALATVELLQAGSELERISQVPRGVTPSAVQRAVSSIDRRFEGCRAASVGWLALR